MIKEIGGAKLRKMTA